MRTRKATPGQVLALIRLLGPSIFNNKIRSIYDKKYYSVGNTERILIGAPSVFYRSEAACLHTFFDDRTGLGWHYFDINGDWIGSHNCDNVNKAEVESAIENTMWSVVEGIGVVSER